MGAYLSEPITEKISTDDESEKIRYGASSMQGWRISQEDAHNCIIDFDEDTSLFAVYDGHGGHEIAAYCSQKLPDFIKNTEAYKNGDFQNALTDAFLEFDATITTKDVINTLKEIAGVKDNDDIKYGLDDEEENVTHLYEEATMPIEQVMEKYQSNLLNPHLKKLQAEKISVSPMLKAKKSDGISDVASCSSSDSSFGASSSKTDSDYISALSSSSLASTQKDDKVDQDDKDVNNTSTLTSNGDSKIEIDIKDTKVEKQELKSEEHSTVIIETSTIATDEDNVDKSNFESKAEDVDKNESEIKSDEKPFTNGEIIAEKEINVDNLTTPQANGGVLSKKGKGKAVVKKNLPPESPANVTNLRARSTRQLLYSKLLQMEEESDSEEENDATFEGVPTYSSSDGSDDESSDGADEEDEEEDSDENEGENDNKDLYEEDDNEFTRNMREEPGSDSGCTAVVALLRDHQLYVANAGDSRCIVCRNGQAVDMSIDHKPEDELELNRILKAGGKVTQDGRVNGGLNLSRAIGDHAYKQNKDLPDKEQMITALPDIKTLTINSNEDEFMVLACDGIWNFMSSQEVVDFVRPRLNKDTSPEKLSHICEELFDHCLAPHTMGDGTGCDNMTAVIVQFKNCLRKRSASLDNSMERTEEGKPKRAKLDDSIEN